MEEILATLTERGQVIVPVEVRRVLGIKPRQKVAFTIEGAEVRLVPATFTLETAYGSVPPRHSPEDFDAMIAEAIDDHADQLVAEMTEPPAMHKSRSTRRE